MNRTGAALTALLLLGSTFSVAAIPAADAGEGRPRAEGGPAEGGKGHGERGHGMDLGLTEDQKKAMQEIHARQREAQKQLFQALQQAQTDLRQLALNGGDEAAIQAKAAEVEKLLGQGVQLRVQALREMAPLLTPEQREKMAKMRHDGPMMRQGPGGHGRGAPGKSPEPKS